jgi:thioesterase domain-containing protein
VIDPIGDELEAVLWEQIPLTKAMGLEVVEASAAKVVLKAPLEPNHNHKATAFGGSLYSLAVLAGWSLLWIRLKQAGLEGHVVIANTDVQYLKPVVDDFQATAIADEMAMALAVQVFRNRGRARVMVTSQIGSLVDPSVRFVGTYALVK